MMTMVHLSHRMVKNISTKEDQKMIIKVGILDAVVVRNTYRTQHYTLTSKLNTMERHLKGQILLSFRQAEGEGDQERYMSRLRNKKKLKTQLKLLEWRLIKWGRCLKLDL